MLPPTELRTSANQWARTRAELCGNSPSLKGGFTWRRHFLRIESYAEPIAGITAALVGPHATDPAAPPGNFMQPQPWAQTAS